MATDHADLPAGLSIGTLGSAATFAGEATEQLRVCFPQFGEPVFFPTMDACWDAIERGLVDVGVLGVERTGQPHHGEQVLRRGLYVCASIALPLQCSFYVKQGVSLADITAISGHGSIHQCARYLDKHFPGLPRSMHARNSVDAAREIVAGTGDVALVASRSVGRIVQGLELVASDIDDGAVSNWWAISAQAYYHPRPDHLIISGRFGPDGELTCLNDALQSVGFRLAVAAGFPADLGVSIYDYLFTFVGDGPLEAVRSALSPFASSRLVGAYKNLVGKDRAFFRAA